MFLPSPQPSSADILPRSARTRAARALAAVGLGLAAACFVGCDSKSTDAVEGKELSVANPAPLIEEAGDQPVGVYEVSPAAEAPVAEAPAAEAPAVETPAAKTPAAPENSASVAASGPPAPAPEPSAWAPETLDTGMSLSGLKITKPLTPPPPTGSKGQLATAPGAEKADLGVLIQGEVVEHTFRLTNSGEEAVVLNGTANSCGCTVAQTQRVGVDGTTTPFVFGQPIAPGESIDILAKVDTDGKKGKLVSTITLQTNSANLPAPLQLAADVQPFVVLEPESYLMLGTMMATEQKEADLNLRSTSGEVFGLELARLGLPDYVNAVLTPVDPNPEGRSAHWKAKITVGPNAAEGQNQSWQLRFVTDVPAPSKGHAAGVEAQPRTHSVVSFVVVQEVNGLVRVSPAYVSFGLVRPGQTVSRTVRLENTDPEFQLPADLVLTRVPMNSAADAILESCFTTNVEVLDAGRVVEITMTLADLPDTFEGNLGGSVEVQVGHPSKPVLSVPYSAFCRPTVQAPKAPAGLR